MPAFACIWALNQSTDHAAVPLKHWLMNASGLISTAMAQPSSIARQPPAALEQISAVADPDHDSVGKVLEAARAPQVALRAGVLDDNF